MSPKVAIDLSFNPAYHRGEDKPVEQVNWYEAQEFCARLSRLTGENYRLPSEAEWEYACRAGAEDYTEYYFGDDASQLDDYGWYGNNSGDRAIDADRIWEEVKLASSNFWEVVKRDSKILQERLKQNNCGTHSVGQKIPNVWGIYDLHGNVWEWCADDWRDSYSGAQKDSCIWTKDLNNYEDAETGRSLRGGSWFFSAKDCRSAYRYITDARDRYYDLGFRVVSMV